MPTRPTPDGYLLIRFREPYFRPADVGLERDSDYSFRVDFLTMKHWRQSEEGVTICFDDRWTVIPWSAIQSIDVKTNSESYRKLLHRYQEQHDHNWVEIDATVDIFGQRIDPRKIECCEPNKTGTDEGCGAMQIDGVMQHV